MRSYTYIGGHFSHFYSRYLIHHVHDIAAELLNIIIYNIVYIYIYTQVYLATYYYCYNASRRQMKYTPRRSFWLTCKCHAAAVIISSDRDAHYLHRGCANLPIVWYTSNPPTYTFEYINILICRYIIYGC